MTSIEKFKLPYRKAVTGYVVDEDNHFLLIQNKLYRKNHWRPPGGGIDEGENPENALMRELNEELGTDKFKVLTKANINTPLGWIELAQLGFVIFCPVYGIITLYDWKVS